MFTLALMFNLTLASAAKKPAVGCELRLELSEDRGTAFFDRLATAATEWFGESSDPRRSEILNSNVVEVLHREDGGGEALVEMQAKLGITRHPVLVRVTFDQTRIKDIGIAERRFKTYFEREARTAELVRQAAMVKFLESIRGRVADLNAEVTDGGSSKNGFAEVLVTASIEGIRIQKIFTVLFNDGEGLRVLESAHHRFSPSVLEKKFTELLLDGHRDRTLRISSIDRLTARSWRMTYTRGKIERVEEPPVVKARSKSSSVRVIRPTGTGVVLKGEGLRTRSMLLEVDDEYEFTLRQDRER